MKSKTTALLTIVLSLCIAVNGAFAQGAKTTPSDQEARERLAYIQTALQNGQKSSNIWYWSWIGIYSGLSIGSYSLFFATDALNPKKNSKDKNHFRQDWMTSGITSTLGVIGLAIDPMVPAYALGRFKDMPEGTPEERLLKLKEAEIWFKKSSQREIDGRSWVPHTLNFVVNLAAGLTIWLAFDRSVVDGLITFLPGMAIGELQIWTQPTRAINDYETYKKRFMTGYVPKRDDDVNWFFAAYPGGMIAGLRF